MAQVDLRIAGRTYEISCRDGEEPHLLALAAVVDDKATQAGRSLGGVNEARQLLLASLLLADELNELRTRPAAAVAVPPPAPDDGPAESAAEQKWAGLAPLLAELADRLETVAQGMEGRAG